MSPVLQAAAALAATVHKDQMYGEHPYTKHLGDVVGVLQRFHVENEDLLVAAWLHDSVEDTETTVGQIELIFGQEVADLVHRVTNEPGTNRKARHEATYPKIKASVNATTLKLADRIANVEQSIYTGDKKKIAMYTKEYKAFREFLYSPGSHDSMWRHLDFLIGEIDV